MWTADIRRAGCDSSIGAQVLACHCRLRPSTQGVSGDNVSLSPAVLCFLDASFLFPLSWHKRATADGDARCPPGSNAERYACLWTIPEVEGIHRPLALTRQRQKFRFAAVDSRSLPLFMATANFKQQAHDETRSLHATWSHFRFRTRPRELCPRQLVAFQECLDGAKERLSKSIQELVDGLSRVTRMALAAGRLMRAPGSTAWRSDGLSR